MYTRLCIARVFDDHRSCQKLINYITNIKAKSKRYHWIQKISVYNDAFRTFTFSMQQCIVYMTNKIRIILIILDFKLGTIDNRKDYLETWGEFFFFHFFFL
jgi:hypothetical protein